MATARGWSSGGRPPPAPRSPSPAPTSPAARPCCARAAVLTSREIGVLAAIGLAEVTSIAGRASRSSPPATRSWRRAQPIRPGAGLRLQRRDPRRRGRGAGRRAGAARHLPGRPEALRPRLRAGSGLRHRPALRRHVEGRRRSRLPGRRPARATGHRRARRRAQARQADLPCGHGRPAGRRAAGLPDLGDLHLPRVRRAGDPRHGRPARRASTRRVAATLAVRMPSERGRTEYLLVSLVDSRRRASPPIPWARAPAASPPSARPTASSPSPAQTEIVPAGTAVEVQLLGRRLAPADLVVIGSHCVGLDLIVGRLRREGIARQVAQRRQHGRPRGGQARRVRPRRRPPARSRDRRLQPAFAAPAALQLVSGYGRLQGIVFRAGDRAVRRRRDRGRGVGRSSGRPRLPDGQPQRRQRHAHPDRPPARRSAAARATGRRPSRTTPSPPPSPRAAPTGASRSSRRPAPTAWASSRCSPSTTTSWCRRRARTGPP